MMDTSETYIKMRLAAIPELGIGTPPLLIPNTEVTWLTTFVFVDRVGNLYYSQIVRPLPELQTCQLERQDQLQEMVFTKGESYHNIYGLMNYFAYWIGFKDGRAGDYTRQFTSMEQLWLAFVMQTLCSKQWDGVRWQ